MTTGYWIDVLFPVLRILRSIEYETSALDEIAANNYELANNKEEYQKVIKQLKQNNMYTEEQIEEFKTKADKWDALEKQIESVYGQENSEGEWEEYEGDEGGDLSTIGEMAAMAFGYL